MIKGKNRKMKCVVTGVAGFIGSHLAERLVGLGNDVVGIDCFTDYYAKNLKEKNLENLPGKKNFSFIGKNLLDLDLKKILSGADFVFHQAAQAGVRASWGKNFEVYVENNILATQKLLEAAKDSEIKKIVFASSSSVYGDVDAFPIKETTMPKPVSPYGVTKLAAENLCYLYHKNFGISVVSLRYFTVYGPRQRPDMAFNKFIHAMLANNEITIYGDGDQTRDFTYVSDIVDSNILAMKSDVKYGIFNVGGGSRITVNEVIKILEKISGKRARVKNIEKQKGDVKHTYADISLARKKLGYKPKVAVEQGLIKEFEWIESGNQ